MPKRSKGEGTIRKRKDGRWEAIIVVGHNESGKPIRKNALAKTQNEVIKKMKLLQDQYRGIELDEKSEQTLGQWLDYWHNQYIKEMVKSSTWLTYGSSIKWIHADLLKKRISNIKTIDIQKMYINMQENNVKIETIRKTHMVLNKAMNDAVKMQVIANNPVKDAVPPKNNTDEIKVFNDAEIKRFMKAIEKEPEWYCFFYGDKLDVIYLYCNKDVTVTSKPYKNIVDLLETNNIEIVPICNQEILNQVMKDERIAWQYFNSISLSKDWLLDQLHTSIRLLGPRYTGEFNIETHTEKSLDYFAHTRDAVVDINNAKNDAISKFKEYSRTYKGYSDIFGHILDALHKLEDVTDETISECLLWSDKINLVCKKEFEFIRKLIEEKNNEKNKAFEENSNSISTILSEINKLQYLNNIANEIVPNSQKQLLIKSQTLILKGEAGAGKSQLLAVMAEKLINLNRSTVLFLGGNFFNNNSIYSQMLDYLSLDINFDGFLNKLEALGIEQNNYSIIFVDAINESYYKEIWKNELLHLIEKLKKFPHIKLVVSTRNGYEPLVLCDAINEDIKSSKMPCVVHNGFRENTISAILTFLNYYNISFSPVYFLQSEMSNPLFLTLFCKTYTGENYDLFTLFEKLIAKIDKESKEAINIYDDMPVLYDFIKEMANVRLERNTMMIPKSDLFNFDFWDEYGLAAQKIKYLSSLSKSGLLIESAYDGEELYCLAYNLLEDFVCAKTIINNYNNEYELLEYIKNKLLNIQDGKIGNYNNIDIFIIVCGIFAEKNKKELFDDIYGTITDSNNQKHISNKYLESFMWRKATSVNDEVFLKFINTHQVETEQVFNVLIENSTKENHPLNAYFLHNVLLPKPLSYRDALWTTFINGLADEEFRIYQLIEHFENGNTLDGLSKKSTELILITFSWLLTSSNRILRDKTSKAMIELLKYNFDLCETILILFENVNDPYVIQRLYGVVFGACVKRIEKDKKIYLSLAKYIFNSIFDQEKVYPDILLRDYARLIIERFIFEYPDSCEFIDQKKINPPYNSEDIPIVKAEEYYDNSNKTPGFNRIVKSLTIDHSKTEFLYGDFGRYVFQYAVNCFEDVDVLNVYHYAMQFIRDELQYNEYLDLYDDYRFRYYYDRQSTKKFERIGKKYEWIAFYNILSRLSDKYELQDYSLLRVPFEGAWEPCVRDFDPTLNLNANKIIIDLPTFENCKDEKMLDVEPFPSSQEIINWINEDSYLFSNIPSNLLLKDNNGHNWIALYSSIEIKKDGPKNEDSLFKTLQGTQKVWMITHASFLSHNDNAILKEHYKEYFASRYPQGIDVYQLFNREYAWSSGYHSIFKDRWQNCELNSEDYDVVIESYEAPDFEHIEEKDDNIIIPMVTKEHKKRIPKETLILKMLPSYSHYIWEEEYDASNEDVVSLLVPCKELIDQLKLEQKDNDGYYYDNTGNLVCYNDKLSESYKRLLIREDYFSKFLKDTNLDVCWTCIGEKQFFKGEMNQEWCSRKGLFYYNDGTITGEMKQYGKA